MSVKISYIGATWQQDRVGSLQNVDSSHLLSDTLPCSVGSVTFYLAISKLLVVDVITVFLIFKVL